MLASYAIPVALDRLPRAASETGSGAIRLQLPVPLIRPSQALRVSGRWSAAGA